MMNNKGVLAVVIGFLVFIVIVILTLTGSYISAKNSGNRAENAIVASHEDMQNILSQYTLKVMEVSQVPAMYKDDLKEIVSGVFTGRYGDNGSQAAFQMISEKNPTLDSSMYKQIQQIMESGRNKYENSQTRLIDTKRAYKDNLGSFWMGAWMGVAGYPKIDLNKYDIIRSEQAVETFKTGIDKGIKLR